MRISAPNLSYSRVTDGGHRYLAALAVLEIHGREFVTLERNLTARKHGSQLVENGIFLLLTWRRRGRIDSRLLIMALLRFYIMRDNSVKGIVLV